MPDIKILAEQELREIVHLDDASVACIENAFSTLAGGEVVMPPIMSLPVKHSNGEVCVKTAYVPGIESFAIKMSPGFFDNPKIGLPSSSGLMVLFSAKTGMLEALLLDNGYLTDVRTAAAGAVAAKVLSRHDSESACIVGTGMQAKLQLNALTLVRPIKHATVWGRDHDKAQMLAASLSDELGIPVSASPELEQGVRAADIVVTTTASAMPLVRADWLQPGQHVTAMGSDQIHKCELEAGCITRATCFVPDSQAQAAKQGELRSAIEQGLVDAEHKFDELGDIVSGKAKGRSADSDITICDLTGTGVQDTAIATLARQRAETAGRGTTFNN